MVVEIYHRRKVYRVWVEETDRKIEQKYKIKHVRADGPAVLNAMIDAVPCEFCSSLRINNICANKKCPGG